MTTIFPKWKPVNSFFHFGFYYFNKLNYTLFLSVFSGVFDNPKSKLFFRFHFGLSALESEMENNDLVSRLELLIGKKKPHAWAASVGIPAATFSRIWNDGGQLRSDLLISISEKCGVSIDWLLTGEGPMRRDEQPVAATAGLDQDEFALVPRYAVEVSAGGGSVLEDDGKPFELLAFRRAWLKKLGLIVERLALVTARGDSMEPTLADGDVLLIDIHQVNIVDGAIHVLRNNGGLLIKRLQLGLGGQVIVRSDNPIYSALETTRDQLDVVGLVVWRGGLM
ncbi:MAG: helix-turn-helix transcriptional regulator [Desulfuromonadales bacterium]|nr:helix-turn-helix transcriptional regulator [Desulfuromonadales bacterium]